MTWVLAQWVKRSRVAAAEVKFTAMAWIQSLARELPYAVGVVKKKKKTQKTVLVNFIYLFICVLTDFLTYFAS